MGMSGDYEAAIAEGIRKGENVTYDLKPSRDDPSAVGTSLSRVCVPFSTPWATAKVGTKSITTTTTKGQLVWVSKAGWRLKAAISYSSTDGSSPWASIPSDASVAHVNRHC